MEPGPDQTATQAAALAYNASGSLSSASAAAPAWDDEAERTVPVLLIDGCESGAGADRVRPDACFSSRSESLGGGHGGMTAGTREEASGSEGEAARLPGR